MTSFVQIVKLNNQTNQTNPTDQTRLNELIKLVESQNFIKSNTRHNFWQKKCMRKKVNNLIEPTNFSCPSTGVPTSDSGVIGKVCIFRDVDGRKKVKKTYEDYKMLESEALSLLQIKSHGLNTPEIYSLTENPNEMIMEYIESEPNPDPYILSLGIKSLHSIKNNKFGNTRDGYILRLKVTNTENEDWCEWWTINRWDILMNTSDIFEESDKKIMSTIRNYIPNIMNGRKIIPSLIHGDYNNGNILVQKNTNKIYFIDSQCYFGDPYYEYLQYNAQSINLQNVNNMLDLLYLSFIYALLHQTLSFKNGYIWRARACMNKIIDNFSPIYPSITTRINKNNYEYIILLCGNNILTNVLNDDFISKIIKYCELKHKSNVDNTLLVLFKTNDWTNIKKQKNKRYIFERNEFSISQTNQIQNIKSNLSVCVDNSNFWSGCEIIYRYEKLFPNLKKTYVMCDQSNLRTYSACFLENQEYIVVNNGKYYANKSKKNLDFI